MEVEIISLFYKDSYLSQFYLRHYDWADKITLITKQLPSGIDNQAQAEWYNEAYKKSAADWVIVCDIDEFVFIGKEDLEKIPRNITVKEVSLFDVYPHVGDKPLDPNLPVRDQRRHGFLMEPFYIKPIVIRGRQNINLGIGCHGIAGPGVKMGQREFIGAHWRNCSLEYAIDTRINKRKNRFSQNNIDKGWSARDRIVTEESIIKEFKDHENDPQVF